MKLLNVLLLSGLIACTSPGCKAQIKANEIHGTWKVTGFTANAPSVDPVDIRNGRDEALSCTYWFRADSTFTMQSAYVTPAESGHWKISDKNEIIMDYNPGGKQVNETYKIERLNSSTMKWSWVLKKVGSFTVTLKKERSSP